MKLEDQVCSLDLARKLKELGVPQESAFYWYPEHQNRLSNDTLNTIPLMLVDRNYRNGTSPNDEFLAAFTTAELGEMLPDTFICKKVSKEEFACRAPANFNIYDPFISKTEANSRAIMLIYLIEEKLLKPGEGVE